MYLAMYELVVKYKVCTQVQQDRKIYLIVDKCSTQASLRTIDIRRTCNNIEFIIYCFFLEPLSYSPIYEQLISHQEGSDFICVMCGVPLQILRGNWYLLISKRIQNITSSYNISKISILYGGHRHFRRIIPTLTKQIKSEITLRATITKVFSMQENRLVEVGSTTTHQGVCPAVGRQCVAE